MSQQKQLISESLYNRDMRPEGARDNLSSAGIAGALIAAACCVGLPAAAALIGALTAAAVVGILAGVLVLAIAIVTVALRIRHHRPHAVLEAAQEVAHADRRRP